MKKISLLALALITALTLSGCGGETGSEPEPETYSPNPYVSLSALEEECGQSMEELFPGFTVSETGEGGYRFDPRGRGEYLLLDGGQTVLTVVSGGKAADFAIPRMFPTSVDAPVTLRLADVTGDGREELVYLSNYEGTGRSAAYITVVDLETLKAVPVDWERSEADMRPQAAALSDEARAGDCRSADWSEADGVILLEVGFTTPELQSWEYLCLVRSPLTFDAKTNRLIAQGPYTLRE